MKCKLKNQRLLYLIQHSNNQMFKIGIATDNLRFKQIDLDYSIDWSKSLYFKGENTDIIFMEKILHRLFFKYRLETQNGTGGTEWFSIECLKKVVDSIIFNVQQSEFNISMQVCETNPANEKVKTKHKLISTYTQINKELCINHIPSKIELYFMNILLEDNTRFVFYIQGYKAFYYNSKTEKSIEITVDFKQLLNTHIKFTDNSGGFNLFSWVQTDFYSKINLNNYFNNKHKEFCNHFNKTYMPLDEYPDIIVDKIFQIKPQQEYRVVIETINVLEELE